MAPLLMMMVPLLTPPGSAQIAVSIAGPGDRSVGDAVAVLILCYEVFENLDRAHLLLGIISAVVVLIVVIVVEIGWRRIDEDAEVVAWLDRDRGPAVGVVGLDARVLVDGDRIARIDGDRMGAVDIQLRTACHDDVTRGRSEEGVVRSVSTCV